MRSAYAACLLLTLPLFAGANEAGNTYPLLWPLENPTITQEFGKTNFAKRNPNLYRRGIHWGVDIASYFGAPVRAAAKGVVEAKGQDACPNFKEPDCNYKLGNWVIIRHPELKLHTFYCHLAEPPEKEIGSTLDAGETIGYQGGSGYIVSIAAGKAIPGGSHLHFSVGVFRVYKNFEDKTDFSIKEIFDPLKFLPPLKN